MLRTLRLKATGASVTAQPALDPAPDEVAAVRLEADTPWALRRSLTAPAVLVAARSVRVVVRGWKPPRPGWSGQLGPVPGLRRYDVRSSRDRVEVRLELVTATPVHQVVSAVLSLLQPPSPGDATVSADVASYEPAPAWLPPLVNTAAFVGRAPDEEIVRPYDVLLGTPPGPLPVGALPVAVDRDGPAVLVDARDANPIGHRTPAPGAPVGRLRQIGPQWTIATEAGTVATGTLAAGVAPHQLPGIRELAAIVCDGPLGAEPADEAALLAQLAMSGPVLYGPALPAATARLLSPDLVAVLAEPGPDEPGPDEPGPAELVEVSEAERRSVRQRRAALRGHASELAWPASLGVIPAEQCRPAVTAVVWAEPGRVPGLLADLAAQTYPELEILLAGPVAGEVRSAVEAWPRPVEVVAAGSLAEAVARARGTLVTVFDQHARYGPEHVWDLVLARMYSGAAIVGRGREFSIVEGRLRRRPLLITEAYTGRVAPQAMLVSRGDLEDLGGWSARLCRAARDRGQAVYRTHPFGLVQVEDSATDPREWTGAFA